MKNENKINGKDLINIGIYGAITCVLMTAVSMIGFVPVLLPMIGVLCPLVVGIPMMLFMTKTHKFGMITIMGTIWGLYLMITGMGYWPAIFGVIFGFLADLICKSGNYKSAKKTVLGFGVFNVLLFGNFVPLYMNIEEYFSTRGGFGPEYAETVASIMQTWTIPVYIIAFFLAGVVGALIGKKVLNKHFKKAGIA